VLLATGNLSNASNLATVIEVAFGAAVLLVVAIVILSSKYSSTSRKILRETNKDLLDRCDVLDRRVAALETEDAKNKEVIKRQEIEIEALTIQVTGTQAVQALQVHLDQKFREQNQKLDAHKKTLDAQTTTLNGLPAAVAKALRPPQ